MGLLTAGGPLRHQGRDVDLVVVGPLTAREAEALVWTAEGKTAWEVAAILGTAEATAKEYLARAAVKLRAANPTHLVTRASTAGILRPR